MCFSDALSAIINFHHLRDDEEILEAHNKINKGTGKRSNSKIYNCTFHKKINKETKKILHLSQKAGSKKGIQMTLKQTRKGRKKEGRKMKKTMTKVRRKMNRS